MECPTCGKKMKKRVGKYGPFWGCTGYPDCRRTVDFKEAKVEGESEEQEKPECLNDETFPCWDCKFRSTDHCPLLI